MALLSGTLIFPGGAYQGDINHLLVIEQEEDDFHIARSHIVFNWMRKDPQSAWWFFVSNESNGYMVDEDSEYMISRDNSLSFPTPKLGAKSRKC